MKPTLVILAAGMGSRYGGMKQLESVGPDGSTIMDYSVYDALRAGFGKIVFIIRPEMEAAFEEAIGSRFREHVNVEYAFQRLDALPAGFTLPADRAKPWGTGHAVLAVADIVQEAFAVINADDFYGSNAFAALGEFFRSTHNTEQPTYAMVGYALRDTLTDAGTVNRGVCRSTADNWLQGIEEITHIERRGQDGQYTDGAGQPQTLAGESPVSMNMWGFDPSLFDLLRDGFASFLRDNASTSNAEFYLPSLIQDAIQDSRVRVRVLPSKDTWYGVTHPEDKARVAKAIHAMVSAGIYPADLWK